MSKNDKIRSERCKEAGKFGDKITLVKVSAAKIFSSRVMSRIAHRGGHATP